MRLIVNGRWLVVLIALSFRNLISLTPRCLVHTLFYTYDQMNKPLPINENVFKGFWG